MTNALFYEFIRRFYPITEAEANALFTLFRPGELSRKEHCQEEGDSVADIYFLETGILRGYYREDGDEITSNFYFGPTLVGDVAALREHTPTRLNMQALTDCVLWRANLADIDTLSPTHPIIYCLFLAFFERLYIVNHKRQLSFIYDSPTQRYLNLMHERPKVISQIPQHYIASYLGIKPESLSRIRRRIMHE